MGKRKALSHDELWDDSALIHSWDEALEEYRLYHSIHASGERVEDVLREAEEEGSELPAEESHEVTAGKYNSREHLNGTLTAVQGALSANEVQVHQDASTQEAPQQSHGSLPDLQRAPSMPSNMAGNDSVLKNLMMSWYFAGYYSGLYEGQKSILKHPVQHQESSGRGAEEKTQSGTSSV